MLGPAPLSFDRLVLRTRTRSRAAATGHDSPEAPRGRNVEEGVVTDSTRRSLAFHTVTEAAELLRVDPVTIYRAIREDAFPAVKIRGRYVVPAQALEALAREAFESLSCVDVADFVVRRRSDAPRRRDGTSS